MKNNLTVFEGQDLEILTKDDVHIEFDGTVLFNGKQVATILGYKRPSDCIRDNVRDNQKYKLKNSDTVNDRFRKLNNAGEMFITEKGVMKLIINSDMPKADDFEDKVWEIVSKVQTTGKFDSIEENLKQIEDETERNLSLGLYSLQQAQKSNSTDLTISILIGQKTSEL
jgi:prophage antirepressor-like protein